MDIPYIVQAIIALLVFAMFCLGMHCMSRPVKTFHTHESFSTSTSHDSSAIESRDANVNRVDNATMSSAQKATKNEQSSIKKTEEDITIAALKPRSQQSANSDSNHYGYTIHDPSTWGMPQRHAPVCMPKSHPEVMPVYTDGVPMQALEVITHKKALVD